ncbi:hypothetical protein [Acinetobacter sp. MD2(2019)]|uniref:hypothetical protein n=1 Tax=Acinetobacter sp. MD2(2019) TaxID=2605273 RepID=UPI002D1EF302|nr:hypothetical protein [Acinetobacter sp. MD2(2019)]MEB3754955.1 hypothetical protein [Acinetobacter sp. MD2(2019)]
MDIVAATKRIRMVQDIETLLLAQIAQNLESVQLIVSTKQGKLSRALFSFVEQNKLMDEADLLLMSEYAVDQKIRQYWINHILKQAVGVQEQSFIATAYIDVKRTIIKHLFEMNQLSDDLVMLAFNSPYVSLIDFAIFVLRRRNFNFNHYFNALKPRANDEKIKVSVLQMLLLNWNKQDFCLHFYNLKNPTTMMAIINKAINLRYLSIAEAVNLLCSKKLKLPFHVIKRLVKIGAEMSDIDDLYALSTTKICFEQRLEIYDDLVFWDRIDWLVKIWKYCNTEHEQQLYKAKVLHVLTFAKNQYYAPIWTPQLKQENWILLKAVGNSFNLYDQYTDEYNNIAKLLKIS